LSGLEGSPWDELRRHVSTEIELDVSKTSLFVRVPINTHIFDGESLVLDGSLEPLRSTPSHVLDGNSCSFRNEDHVGQPMDDNGPVRFLDDVGQDAQSRWDRSISITGIDVDVRAIIPFDVRSVDCILNISPVEVDELLGGSREAEHTPRYRPLFRHAIDVEGRVQNGDFVNNRVEDPTRPRRFKCSIWHTDWER